MTDSAYRTASGPWIWMPPQEVKAETQMEML